MAEQRTAAEMRQFPCNTCGAKPGEPCRTLTSRATTNYHRSRWEPRYGGDFSDDEKPEAAEYRVEFSVQRRKEGEDDFTEIGFGSSGTCGTPEQASFAADTLISRREWETGRGMPDPREA